jgi:simple sugar transport system substrate-binding protein
MTLLAAEPRVEIMDNLDTAYQRAKELFKKYPDLKGIFGTSSLSTPGSARAIEELGLKGKAFVTSVGLPNENKVSLKNGTVDAVLLWDPKDAGYAQLAMAAAVLKGDKIANGLDLKAPGWTSMQFASGSTKVLQGKGWITITKDNVDSFGF